VRPLLGKLGKALLFFAVALCLAPTLVPPLLDRIYYRGPVSDHFTGERFYNPNDTPKPSPFRVASRRWPGTRARWPDHVPVRQTVPPPRVSGEEMRVTWIGHATVLVQTQGLNILTDPVWSHRVSPVSIVGPSRVREPGVAFDRLPKIDLVLISHNHYDHLDLPTLKRLWQRDRPLILTSLGNDTILKAHGIGAQARDWGETVAVRPGVEVVIERNHHWGSRWMVDNNRALWSAFTVRLPGGNIFFAGDTGYGDGSWVAAAAAHGPFRLALIPIGAYQPRSIMQDHHLNPEEAAMVYGRLGAASGLGIHWGTFQLTYEPIDEPVQRLAALRRAAGPPLAGFRTTEAGEAFMVPPLPR
jgi:L-ascorbate metabolism protein UlaG (beta-lactamase superfamily)